jgi:tagatose 6-phosphate kinase
VVILAAGLSPAWQQILLFDAFAPGKVNRALDAHWCGSGKVLNVGLGLAHLGADSRTITALGGPARVAIETEFNDLRVPLRTIPCREATRTCTTILDRSSSSATTELVENARPVAPDELAAFVEACAEETTRARVVVLTGSLPEGVPESLYRDLIGRTPAAAILDARGPELLAALPGRPLVVKPNREELAHTVGRDLGEDADLVAAMRSLNDAGAQWVVVTSGREAVWVTATDATYRLVPPAVREVVNPIGCGDALAAGLAVAIARGERVVDAVRYGMAAAADRLRSLLPGRLDSTRVSAIARGIVVESR